MVVAETDEDGRCTSVTISREENGETLTFTSHYSYNEAGDITQGIDNAGNITKYEYDANGNQTASTDAKGRRIGYTYDDLGNMTKVTYPDGTFETFTYDANGNPGRSIKPVRGCQGSMQEFAKEFCVNILYFMEGEELPWVFPQ